MTHCTLRIALSLVLTFFVADSTHAQQWGNLSGRFVYDGKAATPVKLNVAGPDANFCGQHNPVDESLVVGKDGGLANVVVWVRTKDVKVHPDYDAEKNKKVVINNHECRFDPHVVVYRTGQPLEIKNSDPKPVAHNTKAELVTNAAFNFQIPSDSSQDLKPLTNPESVPIPIACSAHPWMKGWLVVAASPYVAVSDTNGKFEIKNLPAGVPLEFQVWQEKTGYVQKAKIDGKDPGWTRGRFKMTIKPGDNNLGEVKLEPGQFNK